MPFLVHPEGSPSHTTPLEARLAGVTTPPFIPGGMTIQWRQNGALIPGKSGSTDDPALLSINSGAPGDFNLDATDSGSIIDFVIDGSTFSNAVVISNQRPSVTSSAETDAFDRSASRPTINWVFSDADGDQQFAYRLRIGTSVGASDIFDTGIVFSADQSFTLPSSEPNLADASTFHWLIEVTDGEKATPTDPDGDMTPRTFHASSGSAIVNTRPVVSNIMIDGLPPGVITETSPLISWDYADADGQSQRSFRVVISTAQDLSGPIWDSGVVDGGQTSVEFDFDGTGSPLSSHVPMFLAVEAFDSFESSGQVVVEFSLSNKPVITVATVDDRVNPTNLKSQRPTFRWVALDQDGDPIVSYEIRVGDDSFDLGTDSFPGNIWNSGTQSTPEAFQAILGQDGRAFPGCIFPKNLQQGVTYFFQVRVSDAFDASDWFVGKFKLNTPPVAINLAVLPSSPFTSDDLEAKYDFVDDPGESEGATQIRWFRNGKEVASLADQKVVSKFETKPGEQWKFTVRPHDGFDFGPVVMSPGVLIDNRPPVVIRPEVSPLVPRSTDQLTAIFSTNDPDGDAVTVRIQWFRNDQEVQELRNELSVPSGMTMVNERWFFVATPTDGFAVGVAARSQEVTIRNTPPRVLSMAVNGRVLPPDLDDANPTLSWSYHDDDDQPQAAYRVVIGTQPLRVRSSSGDDVAGFACGERSDGIVSTASPSDDVVAGDDIFDSGVVNVSASSFTYATKDFAPAFSLAAPDASSFSGYALDVDSRTMLLAPGSNVGTVGFKFPGQDSLYDVSLEYVREPDKRSSFVLLVDGAEVGAFEIDRGIGPATMMFPAARVTPVSSVTIKGKAVDPGARARFTSLSFAPVAELDVRAGDFEALSGYVSDDEGVIRLAGLAGTAITTFPFPAGTYDVELVYVTESSGSPSASMSVNGTTILSFTYETGVRTRSRFAKSVEIGTGAEIKLSGTRNGSALARIANVIFRPIDTVGRGAMLKNGFSYFASVRVFDGLEWSDWATTRFSMAGNAWSSSISNARGWTIEARFSIQANETQGKEDDKAACNADSFQGIRFYDGNSFGYLRLSPGKVELLVDEPLEMTLDGTKEATYRITGKGRNVRLYVDGKLALDGTGKLTRPTSEKLIEFGDIAGRRQNVGSSWDSLRYSVLGAFAPGDQADFALEEVMRFPGASAGAMREFKEGLYVSVDPFDHERSSMLFRFVEGFPPEPRSVLALTKSTITSVLVDPNRNGNLFGTTGKFVGTNNGLQYILGSKPRPLSFETKMIRDPTEQGWMLDENCEGKCRSVFGGTLTIDTRSEVGSRFLKFSHNKKGDAWVDQADNATGWTIEARVKIASDGSGGLVDAQAARIEGDDGSCSQKTTRLPESDRQSGSSLAAPGILFNDGTYEDTIQFFENGVRLKNAGLFGTQNLSNQFYNVRIIGKGTALAVFVKGDDERFFKRVLFAPEGLSVRSQPVGDQELPTILVDNVGFTHAAWQDSRDGDFAIMYSKTAADQIVTSGSNMTSPNNFPEFNLLRSRVGLELPAVGTLNPGAFDRRALVAGGGAFISKGVRPGDDLIVFNDSGGAAPRRFKVAFVPDEWALVPDTDEDLSALFEHAEYVVTRGEEKWVPPVRVSKQSFDSTNPRMSFNSDGRIYLAYDNNQTGEAQVYVRRADFGAFYARWQETVQVTDSRFDSRRPDVAELPNGNVIVAWEDSRNDKDGSQIFFAEIPRDTFGREQDIVQHALTDVGDVALGPRIVVAGDRIVIAYQSNATRQESMDVFVAQLDVNNDLKTSLPVLISTSTTGKATSPSVCAVGDKIRIAFEDDSLGASEIFVATAERSSPGQDFLFSAMDRITDSRGDSRRPSVACDPRGNVMVAFEDDRNRKGFPDLYLARFDFHAGEWASTGQNGLDLKLESYLTLTRRPQMAVGPRGNLALLFETTMDGSRTRIGRAVHDAALSTMDNTVVAYFPLDDDDDGTLVRNRIREFTGSSAMGGRIPVEMSIVIETSASMSDVIGEAQAAATGLLDGLRAGDRFVVTSFDDQVEPSSWLVAGDEFSPGVTTQDHAKGIIGALAASGGADYGAALAAGIGKFGDVASGFDFASSDGFGRAVIIIGKGTPTTGEMDTAVLSTSANEANSNVKAKIYGFVVSGGNPSLLSSISTAGGGSNIIAEDVIAAGDVPVTKLSQAVVQGLLDEQAFDFTLLPAVNGSSSVSTNVLHRPAPDPGVSLFQESSQGAFEMDANGKVFSVPASLLSQTGAIDLWLRPNWPSTDITTRVLFGNAPLDGTTPNTMTLGVDAATAGNVLKFRIIDDAGIVRQTTIENNPTNPDPVRFSWDPGQLVHLRAIWDANASGVSSIMAVSFATRMIGLAVAASGMIFRTDDGGKTWSRRKTGVTYDLFSIDFVNESLAFASGEFGTILKTEDGGTTWSALDTGVKDDLRGVFFRSSDVGYAVGTGATIIRTTNGGATWTKISTMALSDFNDVGLLSDGSSFFVVAVGADGQVFRSSDDGVSFSMVTLPTIGDLGSITRTHQSGSHKSYVAGTKGLILRTTNGGASWEDVSPDWSAFNFRPNLLAAGHAVNSDAAYVGGQGGIMARTMDGGSTWEITTTAMEDGAWRTLEASFGGEGTGSDLLLGGAGGSIMSSEDGGSTQSYFVVRSGQMTVFIDGKDPDQSRDGDAPFSWLPQDGGNLFFGDFEASGSATANATYDELIIYRRPPPVGALFRRKDIRVFQSESPMLILRDDMAKRLEWGDISTSVKTKSFWQSLDMFLCGALEPHRHFAWTTQLGLVDDVIRDMTLDSRGRLWLATENGVSSFDANAANEDISRWLAGERPLSGPADRFINYTNLVDGLVADSVNTIAVGNDGVIWAGTDRGLMMLDLGATEFSSTGGDPVDEVRKRVDDSGLNEPGAGAFGRGRVLNAPVAKFKTITTDNGLPSDRILVVRALAGSIFVGTDKGLVVITTNEQDVVTGSTATTSVTETTTSSSSSSMEASQSSLDGVMQSAQSSSMEASQATQRSESTQTSTTTESRKRLSIRVFTIEDGLPSNIIRDITQERRNKEIWIATDRGVARFFPDGSITYDASSGLLSNDVFAICVDDDDRKYVGTGFGITRIDGARFDSFPPSSGIGQGAIRDCAVDAEGHVWLATGNGLVEFFDTCGATPRFATYGMQDGLLGDPRIEDYKRFFILGGDVPSGGCNKALVSVAVNGRSLSGGFSIDENIPWIVFDEPLAPSDRVDVCVQKGWRKVNDFDMDSANEDGRAALETGRSRLLLLRKSFKAGTVVLGANLSRGASNDSASMYALFVSPLDEGSQGVSSIIRPTNAEIRQSPSIGDSIYVDEDDPIAVLPSELSGSTHVALASADSQDIDDGFLEMTLASDSIIYVAYDSRSDSLPDWLRSFRPVKATFRVTDMEPFVDASGDEKLFVALSGTAGCVFEVVRDDNLVDISDSIALDNTPPDGCAVITRINSLSSLTLGLRATDGVTGVADMQVSARSDFTMDGQIPEPFVPFQPTFTLELPADAVSPIVEVGIINQIDGSGQVLVNFQQQILVGTSSPGKVVTFNQGTREFTVLFDTGEQEVRSLVTFGDLLVVGTGINGKAFTWDGTTLRELVLPGPSTRVTALATFDNRLFIGTGPDGKIFVMDDAGVITLFMDTQESDVTGFAVFSDKLYWTTSNDTVNEGKVISTVTRKSHRHSLVVPAGATRLSEINATTSEVNGHSHEVVGGMVQPAQEHSHALNGQRSGKVFRYDPATGNTIIVHTDGDFAATTIAATKPGADGLMFAGTFPNGKILRFVPSEGVFIKSFDTPADKVGALRSFDGVMFATADDDVFFFDGRRWQFVIGVQDEIKDIVLTSSGLLILTTKGFLTPGGPVPGVSSGVNASGPSRKLCAFVKFRDAAGNVTSITDTNGKIIDCFVPCVNLDALLGVQGASTTTSTGADGMTTTTTTTTDTSGAGASLIDTHRIVEVDDNARPVQSISGPDPFLSGGIVEEEVGTYFSEVFNGTPSLVQWVKISWKASITAGTSVTLAVRTADSVAAIKDVPFGSELTDASGNDLTNLTGQFIQFRAILRATRAGDLSPSLDFVDIELRTSQAVHYFTTNFSLPDELRRGILTHNSCLNPPATDIVFGISGKDTTDFSEYLVISPNKVFELPPEQQGRNLRVGIKLISSPQEVPVVDEFALLFSMANDAIIRLNLAGTPSESNPPLPSGPTRTVLTESVQGHVHSITFDSNITEKSAINGKTSSNAGHSHVIIDGVVQLAAGHRHEFSI